MDVDVRGRRREWSRPASRLLTWETGWMWCHRQDRTQEGQAGPGMGSALTDTWPCCRQI